MERPGHRALAGYCHGKASFALEKVKLCKFHVSGACVRGETCTFAHSRAELRPQPDLYRTGICFKYLRRGMCDAGDLCNYAHGLEELRPLCWAASLTAADDVRAGSEEAHQDLDTLWQVAEQLHAQLGQLQIKLDTCIANQQARRELEMLWQLAARLQTQLGQLHIKLDTYIARRQASAGCGEQDADSTTWHGGAPDGARSHMRRRHRHGLSH